MPWPEIVGIIGSVATAAGAAWKVFHLINDLYKAMTAVLRFVEPVKKELEHNGGHTVKDSVTRTDDRTARLEGKLEDYMEGNQQALKGIQEHLRDQDRRIDQICMNFGIKGK